jgi:hypothetical protein
MTLAISFILIIFLAAAGLALEVRVTRLQQQVRTLHRILKVTLIQETNND